jgi:hypothetical protein
MTRTAPLAALLLLAAPAALTACGAPQGRPTLPPPEYEDPAPALSSTATPASPPAPSSSASRP